MNGGRPRRLRRLEMNRKNGLWDANGKIETFGSSQPQVSQFSLLSDNTHPKWQVWLCNKRRVCQSQRIFWIGLVTQKTPKVGTSFISSATACDPNRFRGSRCWSPRLLATFCINSVIQFVGISRFFPQFGCFNFYILLHLPSMSQLHCKAFQHLGFDPWQLWREPTWWQTGTVTTTVIAICHPEPPEGKVKGVKVVNVSGKSAMKASELRRLFWTENGLDMAFTKGSSTTADMAGRLNGSWGSKKTMPTIWFVMSFSEKALENTNSSVMFRLS